VETHTALGTHVHIVRMYFLKGIFFFVTFGNASWVQTRNWTCNTEYAMPLTCIYNIQLILYRFIHTRINTYLFDWFQKYNDHSSLFITRKTYSKQNITLSLCSNVSRMLHNCCNYLVLNIKHSNVGLVNICINY